MPYILKLPPFQLRCFLREDIRCSYLKFLLVWVMHPLPRRFPEPIYPRNIYSPPIVLHLCLHRHESTNPPHWLQLLHNGWWFPEIWVRSTHSKSGWCADALIGEISKLWAGSDWSIEFPPLPCFSSVILWAVDSDCRLLVLLNSHWWGRRDKRIRRHVEEKWWEF